MFLRARTASSSIAAALTMVLVTACSSGPATSVPTSAGPVDSSMAMPTATATATASGTYSKLVDPAAFAAAVETAGTVTIDVHVPFIGKIAGTDLTIPYTDIARRASDLPADRQTELAIYCRTGVMSAIAAKELASLGYEDVVELRGGMDAWQAAGHALISTP